MPTVKIYLPSHEFLVKQEEYSGYNDDDFMAELQGAMKKAVIRHLACEDYDGVPVYQNLYDEASDEFGSMLDEVDVLCIRQGNSATDSWVEAQILIEVIDYDYPDRMTTIGARLKSVLKDSVECVYAKPWAGRLASITYIPISRGCRQVTD